MEIACVLFCFVESCNFGGGGREERSRSLGYALRRSVHCPLQELGELARKRGPTMYLHGRVAGKGPFAVLLPLGSAYKSSLASLFSPPNKVGIQKTKNNL
ncbi:hypothetical protein CB4_00716 [Aneurinibacillus soli]|uniref:Uncharacterized protein n=1 Tax=Aneurinibacillus soli TaxID=1500254 RepID=A0A0U5B722_9BACL|nr:hypothetical protein CB4_00716 [Aneurinibacillus soli]